jgi:hypothetical protein
MSAISFKFGGPLTEKDSAVYIQRAADDAAVQFLQRMDYVMITEPRQQGKTSLIIRLQFHPSLSTYVFAYVVCTALDQTDEKKWYKAIGERIVAQTRGRINLRGLVLPQDINSWRAFLKMLADRALQRHLSVVITLDEIGAVPPAWSESFFSVLHDVFTSRSFEREFGHITFILAGTYNPRDLIRDHKVSPFNIAKDVHLTDFTLAQVRELVGRGKWTDKQVDVLARRIHYWTDGQPYLTQLLCSYLKPEADPSDVDTGVDRLRRKDLNHLPPLLKRLKTNEVLCNYVRRILSGEQLRFSPDWHTELERLALLGVIKPDKKSYCTIRNRIYERVLVEILGSQVNADTEKTNEVVVRGDEVAGDKISVGDISDSTGVAVGRGATALGGIQGEHINIYVGQSLSASENHIGEPSDLSEEKIRLDIASPETVEVNRTFVIAVRISQPDSPPLTETDLDNITSRPGRVYRADDRETVKFRVKVSAPDCDVYTDEHVFLLRRGQSSEVVSFQLKAKREGNISIIVTAYQECEDELLAAQTRIKLVAILEAQSGTAIR